MGVLPNVSVMWIPLVSVLAKNCFRLCWKTHLLTWRSANCSPEYLRTFTQNCSEIEGYPMEWLPCKFTANLLKISLVNHATWFKTRCAKMYPLFFTGLHPTIFPSTPRDPASETRRISLFFGRILSEQHGHEFGRTRYSGPNKDRHTSYRQFRKFAPWRDDYNVSTLCRLNISVAYSHKLGGDKASSPLK